MATLNLDDNVLLCPRCGGAYLHHGDVHVHNRVTEDGSGVTVTVAGGTGSGTARDLVAGTGVSTPGWGSVTVREATPAEFAGRRDDVTIDLVCEACGPVGSLVVSQHKGCTTIAWR